MKGVDIVCSFCRKPFTGKEGRQFCSRGCALNAVNARKQAPVFKNCDWCGVVFSVDYSHGDRTRFCGWKCRSEGLTTNRSNCKTCGTEIFRRKTNGGYCNEECLAIGRSGVNSHNWKGGSLANKYGVRIVSVGEKGHRRLHRLVAGKAIGRPIMPTEDVLHIDRNRDNNAAANLFISGSRSETNSRWHGKLPWPERSNLDTYR